MTEGSSDTPLPSGRSAALDLFKTALVVGMIATHVVQLVSADLPDWAWQFADTINLLTFSGFVFAFGLGLGLSAANGRRRRWQDGLAPAFRLLLASYVSSLAFILLVDQLPLTQEVLTDVLLFRRLFGWSEFLATFLTLYCLLWIGRPLLLWLTSNWVVFAVAMVAFAASTYLTNDDDLPLVPTLVGTHNFASFPLLPYLPWLLFGIVLGRTGIRLHVWHWVVAIAATAACYAALWMSGEMPGRFPPTIPWIIGPAAILLLYLAAAQAVAGRVALPPWLLLPGQHILSFLLFSNLAIFLIRFYFGHPVDGIAQWLGLTAALIACPVLAWASQRPDKART